MKGRNGLERWCLIVCALGLGCEASAASGPDDAQFAPKQQPPRTEVISPSELGQGNDEDAEAAGAKKPEGIDASEVATLEVVNLEADAGPLGAQIRRYAAHATEQNKRVFLEMGAPWCPPCKRAKTLLAKPEVAAKLSDVLLLRVDSDVWIEELDELGFDAPVIPTYYALDAKGASTRAVRGSTWKTRALVEQKLLAFLQGD